MNEKKWSFPDPENQPFRTVTETASWPVITGGGAAELDILIAFTAANANVQWRSFNEQPAPNLLRTWIESYAGKRLHRLDLQMELWTIEDSAANRISISIEKVWALLTGGPGLNFYVMSGVDYHGQRTIFNPTLIDWGFHGVMGWTVLPAVTPAAITSGMLTASLTYSEL